MVYIFLLGFECCFLHSAFRKTKKSAKIEKVYEKNLDEYTTTFTQTWLKLLTNCEMQPSNSNPDLLAL